MAWLTFVMPCKVYFVVVRVSCVRFVGYSFSDTTSMNTKDCNSELFQNSDTVQSLTRLAVQVLESASSVYLYPLNNSTLYIYP